jgi:hypothetical protein
MTRPDQTDLFGHDEDQTDLFGADAVPAYRPDPEKVRSRLHKILAEARAAKSLPWEPTTVSLYRTIFPQMSLFLPDDEGAQLRFVSRLNWRASKRRRKDRVGRTSARASGDWLDRGWLSQPGCQAALQASIFASATSSVFVPGRTEK